MGEMRVSRRAADELVRYFTDQIRSGALRDGDPLPPEREIVERHRVSRTVAREAIQALANKGLVEARPRFRPVVRAPSFEIAFHTVDDVISGLLANPDGVRNLFETRIMIEAALARGAARDASDEAVARIGAALEANRAAIGDSMRFFATDIAFHAELFEIPRNPVLPALHRAYAAWLSPQWSRMRRTAETDRINFDAHVAIYQAIAARDPDAAEAALRAHLDCAWEQVRQTFDPV